MNKSPFISVVIATFNSENTLEKCLNSVRKQNYPQERIDITLVDGNSKDNTLKIGNKFKTKIIPVDPRLQNAEYNKGVGIREAKGELILMIDHDNILPHKEWLKKMLKPLLDDKEVVAVETLRYHYDPKASLLDRYFALFGAGDPLAFYLGKADRLSFIYSTYNLFGKAKDLGDYYTVEFNKEKISTLGANGFLIRKKILLENAKVDSDHFFHIDVNVDLIKKGFNKYAFIKDDIIHLTGYKNISSFLYRRKLFMEQYHIKTHSQRRYSVYEQKDKLNLIKFIFYASTFVKPTFDSFRGFLKIKDSAWFLHPFLSFSLLSIYTYVMVKSSIRNYAKQILPK
ncbi:glycosyltransferase [Candidatus Microgenomates bacterium]|nr:MAG: glycosyltransferase [Candidatus Microgenomates bacterium]